MDEREQRDAEINKVLQGLDKLINPVKSIQHDTSENDEMDELVDLVQGKPQIFILSIDTKS